MFIRGWLGLGCVDCCSVVVHVFAVVDCTVISVAGCRD